MSPTSRITNLMSAVSGVQGDLNADNPIQPMLKVAYLALKAAYWYSKANRPSFQSSMSDLKLAARELRQ
jgi:hypothetical protein